MELWKRNELSGFGVIWEFRVYRVYAAHRAYRVLGLVGIILIICLIADRGFGQIKLQALWGFAA